ncbi:MAG: hypothetical protein MZV63_32895 [Marinilabiliales bacterium]|nr:hypothetical protein [Marinilabiliales bacterium]
MEPTLAEGSEMPCNTLISMVKARQGQTMKPRLSLRNAPPFGSNLIITLAQNPTYVIAPQIPAGTDWTNEPVSQHYPFSAESVHREPS